MRRAGAILAAMAAAMLPCAARAHLETSGLGPVYDGILHIVLGPDDLVPVLAMAALAGQNGTSAARRTLLVLPLAWLAAGLAGYGLGLGDLPRLPAFSFLMLGLLVAAGRPLPVAVVMAIAAAVGLLHGALNGAGIAEARREPLALAGIVAVVFVAAALVSAFVTTLRVEWARIAVRVAGSWVAAIGLLMLGWSLRAG